MRRALLALAAAATVLMAATTAVADPPGPVGTGDPVINLAGGFTYTIISTGCTDSVTSTESGGTFPMPEDFDANVVFSANDETWLISNHELTQPRPGDFQGDAGKCAVPEQTAGDGDSDGSGSVSRIVLAKDGVTVLRRELITTGLHDTCAGAKTPWNTYLTNEEFPFVNDPDKLSGWVWEIDPAMGAEKRLTGMGNFSHEQEARVGKNWYLRARAAPTRCGCFRAARPERRTWSSSRRSRTGSSRRVCGSRTTARSCTSQCRRTRRSRAG